MFGMLLVGITMYLLLVYAGHYYIEGVGYATIVDILQNLITSPWLLLLLIVLKLLSTFFTLSSGASGGVFSPSLFLGATIGAFFGVILQTLIPGMTLSPIVFAIAGMAGMVGSATGAVLTAVTMVSEMTNDSSVVLPILITVAAAYIVRKVLSSSSIYTLKLLRRGEVVPEGLQAAVAFAQVAKYIMDKHFRVLTLEDLQNHPENVVLEDAHFIPTTIISSYDEILGVLDKDVTQGKIPLGEAHTQIDNRFIVVHAKATLPDVARAMNEYQAKYALVTPHYKLKQAHDIVGIITKKEILNSTQQSYCLL